MDPDRLARLTEQQRACLRYVFAHLTSKEIAPHLGIAPNSVDQHIKAAMRTLGTSDRRAAARMLAEYEGAAGRQPLVYQMPELASHDDPATMAASVESGRRQHGVAMREEQAAFEASAAFNSRGFMLPLPIRGGKPSDLSSLRRLMWIIVLMLVIAFAFGVFLAGLEALSRLTHPAGS
jgi:DNA-binding CsgD family transcriptional regulator